MRERMPSLSFQYRKNRNSPGKGTGQEALALEEDRVPICKVSSLLGKLWPLISPLALCPWASYFSWTIHEVRCGPEKPLQAELQVPRAQGRAWCSHGPASFPTWEPACSGAGKPQRGDGPQLLLFLWLLSEPPGSEHPPNPVSRAASHSAKAVCSFTPQT